MKKKLITAALTFSSFGIAFSQNGGEAENPEINPNIGHRHHHHHYGEKHETEEPTQSRFDTSRKGAAKLKLPKEKDAFSFVVFGDRTGGAKDSVAILADAVRDVNLMEPDLVMTVGDLVQGYTQEEPWLEQAREYKDVMNQLQCPWFPVAGNHDVYWRGSVGAPYPVGGNEKAYEIHFGPLWYAFEHKNSWFIVLYSDEGNPASGEQSFRDPEAQKMSPEQFEWLDKTLTKAQAAEHVFLFLHHPRWLKGGYGDDWEKVHERLKMAGNVSAVFAGHIHQMRYDGPKDGIEYITLATTGGHQPGTVPEAGYLHHFDVVTVRKDRLALTAIPVGQVMDIREISGELVAETNRLAALPLDTTNVVDLEKSTVEPQELAITVSNPVNRPVEMTLTGNSTDSRWKFVPDHTHFRLKPGESRDLKFTVRRPSFSLDADFMQPYLAVEMDYLAEGFRYTIPERNIAIPMLFPQKPSVGKINHSANFDGRKSWLSVASDRLDIGEKFTLECRFKARSFSGRTGLVTKTQGSEYGIFISDGRPVFSVHLGGDYVSAKADTPLLKAGQWHHLAGVFDGSEVRLYLDGKLVAKQAGTGIRTRNSLPLIIGGDVTDQGSATSLFSGEVDEVRLSRVVRYSGESISFEENGAADGDTALLLDMVEKIGSWFPDSSERRANAVAIGSIELLPLGN